MNDLNSVLIEGTVHGDIDIVDGVARFRIISRHNIEQEMVGEIFDIMAYGNIAAICHDALKHGKRIRAIGTLRHESLGIAIVADHIDIRG